MQVTKEILYTSQFGVGATVTKNDNSHYDYDEKGFLNKPPFTVVSISTTKFLYPDLFSYLVENSDGERKHFSSRALLLLKDTNAHISVTKTQNLVSEFNIGDNIFQKQCLSRQNIPCKVIDIRCIEDSTSKTFSFAYLVEYTEGERLNERKLLYEYSLCAGASN